MIFRLAKKATGKDFYADLTAQDRADVRNLLKGGTIYDPPPQISADWSRR